jgi:hypothetical protein
MNGDNQICLDKLDKEPTKQHNIIEKRSSILEFLGYLAEILELLFHRI